MKAARAPARGTTGSRRQQSRIRTSTLVGPSQVLVSSTVKDLVAGSGLVFEDRGEHVLKGVPEKWRLYAVAASVQHGGVQGFDSLRSTKSADSADVRVTVAVGRMRPRTRGGAERATSLAGRRGHWGAA